MLGRWGARGTIDSSEEQIQYVQQQAPKKYQLIN